MLAAAVGFLLWYGHRQDMKSADPASATTIGMASAVFDPHIDAKTNEQRGDQFREFVRAEQSVRRCAEEVAPRTKNWFYPH